MIKRIYNYVKNNPFNPVLLVIMFALIGGVALFLFQSSDKSIDYFLTFVSIGVSAAIVQCSMIQNRIQKDNVKIQLFDKRFAVYQSVIDTITIIKRNNWDRYLLFSEVDVNKQMIQIEEALYKSVQLSACLFDNMICDKLYDVNDAFCGVVKSYKDMIIENAKSFSTQEEIQEYLVDLNSYILSPTGLNSKECEELLKKKYPKSYILLMDFCKECDAYISLINESGIIKDFRKYIIIDGLDR